MDRRAIAIFGCAIGLVVAILFLKLRLTSFEPFPSSAPQQMAHFRGAGLSLPRVGCLIGDSPRILVDQNAAVQLSAGGKVNLSPAIPWSDCLNGVEFVEVFSALKEPLLFRDIGLMRVSLRPDGVYELNNSLGILGGYFNRIFAPYFPGVRILKEHEIRKFQGKVIDVRPTEEWQAFHIPNSFHLPYLFAEIPVHVGFPLREALKSDQFDIGILKDKEEPLAIVSEGPRDDQSIRAIRALFALSEKGFRDLHWYWGGVQGYRGESFATPRQPRDIKVVTAREVVDLLALGALPIDVRPQRRFQFGHIPGAQNITYIDPPSGALRAEILLEIESGRLRRERGVFQKALPQNERVWIFYGHDYADWNAYFAALIAEKSRGDDSVFWMRGGAAEWAALNAINSRVFQTVGRAAR